MSDNGCATARRRLMDALLCTLENTIEGPVSLHHTRRDLEEYEGRIERIQAMMAAGIKARTPTRGANRAAALGEAFW